MYKTYPTNFVSLNLTDLIKVYNIVKPKPIANRLHLNCKTKTQSKFPFPSKKQLKFRDSYQLETLSISISTK